MHPFPQIEYVIQDICTGSFGYETVICGNNDSTLEEGKLKDPIWEGQREERGAANLFDLSE